MIIVLGAEADEYEHERKHKIWRKKMESLFLKKNGESSYFENKLIFTLEDTFIEYAYLWKDNQWYGKDRYDKEDGVKGMGYKEFTPLNQILIPIEKKIVEYQLR